MKKRAALLCALILFAVQAWAVSDNPTLQSVAKSDQLQRSQKIVDWQALSQQDRERVATIRKLLKNGEIRTANDYANAAIVLNHGSGETDFRLAAALAEVALSLEPQNPEFRRHHATTWDRMMLSYGRPQWYGTQYSKGGADKPYALDPIDEKTTDAQRTAMGVLTLAESRKKIDKLNLDEPVKAAPASSALPNTNSAATVFLAKDVSTMVSLIEKQPALGLFWFKLAESGLGQSLQAKSTVKMQTFAISRNKADALSIVKGEKPIFDTQSSGDACLFNYDAAVDTKQRLELDVVYDCKVKPGPKLVFNPTHRFKIFLSGLNSNLQGRDLRLVSIEEVKLK